MVEKIKFKNLINIIFSILIILFSIFLFISSIALKVFRSDIIYYPIISIAYCVVSVIFLFLGVYNLVNLIVRRSSIIRNNFISITTLLYVATFIIVFLICLSYYLFSPNQTIDEVLLAEVMIVKVVLPVGFSFSIASIVLILCSYSRKRKPTTKKILKVVSCFLTLVPIVILALFVFSTCLFHVFVFAQATFCLLEIIFGIYLSRITIEDGEHKLIDAPVDEGEAIER